MSYSRPYSKSEYSLEYAFYLHSYSHVNTLEYAFFRAVILTLKFAFFFQQIKLKRILVRCFYKRIILKTEFFWREKIT